jgi:hypothetical protein
MPNPVAKVVRGHLVPSTQAVTKILGSLKKDVAADPKLKAAWKKDPRQVLASRGLNNDLQREILSESGIRLPTTLADWCVITCITTSCCCTECCISI